MNVVITLPKNLISSILQGEKKFEMRKNFPMSLTVGSDGFFVVEKGTNSVHCWCRVKRIHAIKLTPELAYNLAPSLCVSPEYILKYQSIGLYVYLWEIDMVVHLPNTSICSLGVSKNPQNFAYCYNSCGIPKQ